MKNTLIALIFAVLAASLAEMLAPEGGTKRYFRFLVSLLVLLLLGEPLWQSFSKSSFSFDDLLPHEEAAVDFEAMFEQTADAAGREELRRGIARLLEEQFGIGEGECEIKLSFDGDGMPSLVSVRLYGGALLKNPREVQDYLAELLDCETEVR